MKDEKGLLSVLYTAERKAIMLFVFGASMSNLSTTIMFSAWALSVSALRIARRRTFLLTFW